jgi:hypothetical protein
VEPEAREQESWTWERVDELLCEAAVTRPLTPEIAEVLAWPALYLAAQERPKTAIHVRMRARQDGWGHETDYAKGRGFEYRSTYDRCWRYGCQEIAKGLQTAGVPVRSVRQR